LSLNVFNIGLQCNLRFFSTTVLQGSVATRVNYGKTFNDIFIAYLLLSIMVKEFWRSVKIRHSYGKKPSGTFFPDTVYSWNSSYNVLRRYFADIIGLSSTTVTYSNRPVKLSEVGEITQNKGHYTVQAHSRSPMSVPIESPYAASY